MCPEAKWDGLVLLRHTIFGNCAIAGGVLLPAAMKCCQNKARRKRLRGDVAFYGVILGLLALAMRIAAQDCSTTANGWTYEDKNTLSW